MGEVLFSVTVVFVGNADDGWFSFGAGFCEVLVGLDFVSLMRPRFYNVHLLFGDVTELECVNVREAFNLVDETFRVRLPGYAARAAKAHRSVERVITAHQGLEIQGVVTRAVDVPSKSGLSSYAR